MKLNFVIATLLLFCGLFCGQNLFAADCVDSAGNEISNMPEVFTPIIENAKSCYEAAQMAEACAWGSSLDVATAGAAYSVCERELATYSPTKDLTSLLALMNTSCTEKYENEEGTMYRSMNAYCSLSAIEWIVNLASPN